MKKFEVGLSVLFILIFFSVRAQVPPNINSNNPNFPFPQFKSYTGAPNTLANLNPVGVPHAEMEQRARDAYRIVCNNMTYNVNKGGAYAPVTVAGVKYISPTTAAAGTDISHCTCVEGDGYYLLAAAYMGDKLTFDGYFMWMHDRQFQKTQRYIDGVINSPAYAYSPGISGAGSAGASTDVLGGALGGNSATDGDVDVALALLVAWKQWGDLSGITPPAPYTGGQISYKQEAIKYIKTLVDTLKYAPSLPIAKYLSGDIGLDGYHKGGDSWQETTNWASGGTYLGLNPSQGGPQTNYVDYAASGYFRSFGDMLQAEGQSPWCIKQYRRGETSDDWLVGQAYAQGLLPWAGQYSVTGTTASFSSFADGEDFRFGWRTILNQVWNGSPARTWNPTIHQDVAGTNTYLTDAANRFANFLKAPEAAPYNNTCKVNNTLAYGGPPNVKSQYNMDGTGGGAFPLNWAQGTGAPSAVISGDADLMAQMFRQCVIEWDQYNNTTQKYLTSNPRYFHEWFRLLGMLVLSGNYHDPLDMDPTIANMKVYKAVDKTYAYVGDTITYTLSYRNYAKQTANNVLITDNLPAGLQFISASNAGSAAGSVVSWAIGTVPGFVTGGLAATQGSVTLKVKVTSSAATRICNTANITCSNGSGWVSNEYPNNISDVMQRNCVDILTVNPLTITKVASKSLVNPGDTLSYTITVKNGQVAFLNGGRQGVLLAAAHDGVSTSANSLSFKYRIYHGAHEAYINYQNYRVSYFLNKPGPPTWILTNTVNEGSATVPTPTQQTLTPGATWNHRFILQFPNQIATITQFLYFYSGLGRFIHEGALMPQRLVSNIHAAGYPNFNWSTDWSAEPGIMAADGDPYWPIANDWTDPLVPNKPVLKYHPNNCTNNVTTTAKKQLVEEWDGYTWRRVGGDAPVSGRDLNNITIKDILPPEVVFGGYIGSTPTGIMAGSTITWPNITQLKINDSAVYKIWVTVKNNAFFGCPGTPTPSYFTNTSTGKADNEALVTATSVTNVTCNAIPPPAVANMKKLANAASYSGGSPVTYTIKYKNTDGTVVSGATVAADWNDVIGGGKLAITAGTIDLNPSNVNKGMVYKYSHGTNGFIKGTMTLAQYQSPYAVIMRYNGTTWVETRFNVQNANVQISFFSMPANTQIGSTQTITYGALPGAFDFQIQLTGATVGVWLVNAGATISGSAPITQGTIPVQAGYAGIRTSQGSASSLANWYTHLDSGFNIQLTDPIPGGITFGSANNASLANCASCGAGPYTGSNAAGTVTWQNIPGPVLANDSLTYVWAGTVSSCPSATILNVATIAIKGISPAPSASVTSNCTAAAPVSLLDFQASPENNAVFLQWSTSTEINNDYFGIERSYDGIHFETIGKVKGNGNSKSILHYDYIDYSFDAYQTSYYRLAQTDYDGKINYSNVRSVNPVSISAEIYPNPFTNEAILIIRGVQSESISVKVISPVGKEVYSIVKVELNKNINIGGELASGMYVVELTGQNYHENIRVMKQ